MSEPADLKFGDDPPAALFFVPGLPQPGGSKKGFVVKGRAVITEDNKKSRPWRERVASVAVDHYGGPPLDGPLALEVVFTLPRPKGHFGRSGAVLASARAYPTTKPDATKLLRALEDSLKNILWLDDSQVVCQQVTKVYGERPGAMVCVRRLYP